VLLRNQHHKIGAYILRIYGVYLPQQAQTLFLMGLDPGAERSLRELSILFAEAAKFYSSNTIELVAATPI